MVELLPCATHVMVEVDCVEDVSMLSMLNCSIRWANAFEYLGGRYFWLSSVTSFHMSLVKLNLKLLELSSEPVH